MKYTLEEQELIDKINVMPLDHNRIAELLISKVGDMSFNAKLKEDQIKQPFLLYFTYKTREIDQFVPIALKLDIALELRNEQLPIEDYEKLTLAEYSKISDLKSLNDEYEGLLQLINNNCDNSDFQELYSNIKKSSDLIEKLGKGALEANNYKSGDLMMYLSAKTATLKRKQNLSGHEGKLEEIFMTKYNHAAPIYIDHINQDNPIVTKSDIWKQQRSDALSLEEILESDALRIDPTKLVNKNHIAALEKIDYGYKKDEKGERVKTTWQEVMKDRYEQLSSVLHVGQVPHQIKKLEQLKQDQKAELNNDRATEAFESYSRRFTIKLEKINDELKELSTKLSKFDGGNVGNLEYLELEKKIIDKKEQLKESEANFKTDIKYQELQEAYNIKNKEYIQLITKIDAEIKDKELQLLQNDDKRLGAEYWINPATILEGHNQWFSSNDFRDLSEKMYNAEPNQREMICSEFAARSIVSVIDQLNRITAIDLQAAELIDKEERIIKEPISKKENFQNLHPERLAKILETSGCVEKIENKFLKNLIQLENIDKSQIKEEEYAANLPKRIYSILQSSESKEAFKNKASKVVGAYLKAAKVEGNIIQNARVEVLDHKLDEIYKQYTRQPEGILEKIGQVFTKVLEFCKLYTKDASAKKNLNLIVNEIVQSAQENQSSHIIDNEVLKQQPIGAGKRLYTNILQAGKNSPNFSSKAGLTKAEQVKMSKAQSYIKSIGTGK